MRRERIGWLQLLMVALLGATVGSENTSAQQLGVDGDFLNYSDGSVKIQVRSVIAGSLAQQIGILPGDQVISINGIAPNSAAMISQAVARGGNRTSVIVERRGQRITLPNAVSFRPDIQSPVQIPNNGLPNQTFPNQGFPTQSFPNQGFPNQGFPNQGVPTQTFPNQGFPGQTTIPTQQGPRTGGNRPPDLGVSHQWQDELGGGSRLLLTSVPPGSLGFQSGLRSGDVITSVNGTPASSRERFNAAYVLIDGKLVFQVIRSDGRRENVVIFGQGRSRPSLGLGVVWDAASGLLRVTSADPLSIGAAAGVTPGTLLQGINGRAVNSRDQLDRIDARLAAGELDEVIFKVVDPSGRPRSLRHPLR